MAQTRHQLSGGVAHRLRVLIAILMLIVMGLLLLMCPGHGVLHLGPVLECPFPQLIKPIPRVQHLDCSLAGDA